MVLVNYKVDHIDVDKHTRPGTMLSDAKYVVWHYTANPGATAEGHQNYFDNLHNRYASAHIFIDRNSVVEIIPLNEVAYHAGNAWYNNNSIGVELCIEEDGSFDPNTIAQAIEVGSTLAKRFEIDPVKRFIRHYDVTGKICPKPWVDDPHEFVDFKQDVKDKLYQPQLSKSDAEKIIRFLQAGWYIGGKEEFHRLANEVRKVAGISET